MDKFDKPTIAIIDYGMGNLFSIKNACEYSGMQANITSCKEDLLSAEAVILPGVGAFSDAVASLKRLDLITVIKDVIDANTPFVGICLGMHLLLNESSEFEHTRGLGIIKGRVVAFDRPFNEKEKPLKIPHIGWNRINNKNGLWENTMLDGLNDVEMMYFAHSFYCELDDPRIALSTTPYGGIEFCSSFQYKNIFACQFHPEKSGERGILVYNKLLTKIKKNREEIIYG